MYAISIRLGNDLYESKGESMAECLRTLPQPTKIMAKGIITLKKGDKTREFFWMPVNLKKIWYKSAPIYLAKSWELLVA